MSVEKKILEFVDQHPGCTSDEIYQSLEKEKQIDIENSLKSLCHNYSYITLTNKKRKEVQLDKEGVLVLEVGKTPEAILFSIIPKDGSIKKSELSDILTKEGIPKGLHLSVERNGMGNARKNKWVSMERLEKKDMKISRICDNITDTTISFLNLVKSGKSSEVPQKEMKMLKKRKFIIEKSVNYWIVNKGESFCVVPPKKALSNLSERHLKSGEWAGRPVKDYNWNALGAKPTQGYLHPLLKVKRQFKNIFLELGFEEMRTNHFVESSFWNFDALFQPQQHPARDAHDTYFLKTPSTTAQEHFPQEYLKKVKETHEMGGTTGSIGYRYVWKVEEAQKNILRTHTTAVSARYLSELAKEYKKKGFTPRKFFSIDRVFRNEVPDATHLCEFQQIEGMVVDKNITLGDLIGLFTTFFNKIGIHNLVFKPTYNPYTEPSMEIFTKLNNGKIIEIGNSGIFRPEMLKTLGFDDDVSVLAWGLGLERPTMVIYGITNIRDLVGAKVDVERTENSPFVDFDKIVKDKKKE